MGSRIIALAKEDKDVHLSGEFDIIEENPEAFIEGCDSLIEFTSPEATLEHLDICVKHKKAIVVGTTGLSGADIEKIKDASAGIPVILSPNMSVGVNLLFRMINEAAKSLGAGYEIQIVEAHHTEKKDAPSGTAKEMARIVKEHKKDIDVPIESIREGDIVGEHTITFESDVDVIEITHSAKTRDIFAKGALHAAKWLAGKKPGLYTMKDVLGL
jgi:4-hydroxy-tetrahydrodipicolinate reductase